MAQAVKKPQHLNSHALSPSDISALVQLLANIRPDWDSALVAVVLHSHRDQVPGIDLAIAALRAAKSMTYSPPKAIGWRGSHWDHAKKTPHQPNEAYRCGICGKAEPRCLSDRFGDDDHPFEPTGRKVPIR